MSEHKAKKWAIIALLLSIISIGISESITTTSDTLGLQIVVNNTNLAPFVAGHGGIGARVGNNTTYWNNNTPIEIFLYSHANTSGTAAEIHLFINGTKVSDTSGRALGIAEQSNRSIVAIVPQYSYYSVEMVNYHHYEWYEYQILTGNVTTNLTGVTGGCTGNCYYDNIYVNNIGKNTSAVIGLLNDLKWATAGTISADDSYLHMEPGIVRLAELNGGVAYSYIEMSDYTVTITNANLSMAGNNITNSPTIDAKVNKSGDTMTGDLITLGNMAIGNKTGSFGFSQNYSGGYGQYGSLVNYDSSYGSYIGITENAYFNTTEQYWYRYNDSKGSVIFQIVGVSKDIATAYGEKWSIQMYAVNNSSTAVNHRIEYTEFYDPLIIYNDRFVIGANTPIYAKNNITTQTIGKGYQTKEGTNAKQGTCTMIAGNCVVSNTAITTNSRLFYNYQAPCTANIGTLYEVGRNATINFSIRNTNLANTCTIAYEIFEPS